MKKELKKGLIVLIIGFLVLFGLRLAYGYYDFPMFSPQQLGGQTTEFEFKVNNYASSQIRVKKADTQQTYNVDQKYEKIATLNSQTSKFNDDENKVRDIIKRNNALIQFEQNVGLKSDRVLHLAIGVHPDKFDHMVDEIKKIGTITSLSINKFDKTNEYQDLNAKKVSLEETRRSLLALKGQGGKIDEFINLENRILEIEGQIQQLGISLGKYDVENEFCTVKFSLMEKKAPERISLIRRTKVALEWTIKYYFLLIMTVFFGGMSTLITVSLIKKLNWVPSFIKKHYTDYQS